MDRLVLLCSAAIVKRINITNVGATLADATHFHAMSLVRSLQCYMAVNMETLLESRFLDELPLDLIRQLSFFVRQQQKQKYPLSRSNSLVDKAMKSAGDWLALQDIPQPIVPTFRPGSFRDSPKLSPPASSKRLRRQSSLLSPPSSPTIRPQVSTKPNVSGPFDDEVFIMDEQDVAPASTSVSSETAISRVDLSEPPNKASGWKKVSSAPRYVWPRPTAARLRYTHYFIGLT